MLWLRSGFPLISWLGVTRQRRSGVRPVPLLCVHMCVCLYVCMCASAGRDKTKKIRSETSAIVVCAYVHMCVCMYACMHVCMYAYTHVQQVVTRQCICLPVPFVFVCDTHTHTHIGAMHAYIPTYIHHTHMHTQGRGTWASGQLCIGAKQTQTAGLSFNELAQRELH